MSSTGFDPNIPGRRRKMSGSKDPYKFYLERPDFVVPQQIRKAGLETPRPHAPRGRSLITGKSQAPTHVHNVHERPM